VQVFFNFEGKPETSFDNLATMGVDKYIEKTQMLENQKYSEYLIPVIPNFTIIPKDKSGVMLDYKMKFEALEIVNENNEKVLKEKEAKKLKNRIKRLFNKKQPKPLIFNPNWK